LNTNDIYSYATTAAGFITNNLDKIKCPYDVKLPPTSPENLALITITPLVAVALLSIGTRVVSGAVGLGAKAVSEVANLASRVTTTIDQSMDYAGDQFISYSKRSINEDLKLAVSLTAATLTGVALFKFTPLLPARPPFSDPGLLYAMKSRFLPFF
jgi:hypothetical protein